MPIVSPLLIASAYAHSATGQARRKPKKATSRASAPVKPSRPVQLTIFDYAARIGVTLLPEAS